MGGAGLARTLSGAAAQPHTVVNFPMPAEACDSHTHIFGTASQFPWFAGRTYTPESALPEEMRKLHDALHVRRVVIVTPSVYGTDNSATLYGMKACGQDARGVAVIDEKTPAAELDRLTKAGFRGMRINLATGGQNDPVSGRRRLEAALKQAKNLNWHIQMFTSLEVIAAIRDLVLAADVPIVFDHFGGAKAAGGAGQTGFGDLQDLLRSGHAYVKVSGAYRASTRGPDYVDAAPLARALIHANPDRVLWGTDWPHPDTTIRPNHPATEVTPLLPIDDGRLLNQLAAWTPDGAIRKKILVENPARLYGFR
jgi:predicted TIM-barrel fold metal-dependent hydrolase